MLRETFITIFNRDLIKLKTEINSYKDEKNLWLVEKGVSNCAGNLCLHIVGNLNAFIGASIGNSGYVRQRDLEFSLKDVPRAELIKQVDAVMTIVENTLTNLTADDLAKDFPIDVFNRKMTTEFFLVHLTTHLSYHLGQINYHRRLLD